MRDIKAGVTLDVMSRQKKLEGDLAEAKDMLAEAKADNRGYFSPIDIKAFEKDVKVCEGRLRRHLNSLRAFKAESDSQLIAKAEQIGAKAFHDGKSNAPAQSRELMALLPAGAKVGNPLTNKLMDGFIKAWHMEQRAWADKEIKRKGI